MWKLIIFNGDRNMSINLLLNGFSDVISRYNLATNGLFIVNQRNLFTDFDLVNVDDFVSDCWKVSLIDIDYCEVRNNVQLALRGYGKKGQSISIINMDKTQYGKGTIDINNHEPFTASIFCHELVSVSVDVYPRFTNTEGYYSYVYNKIAKLPGDIAVRAMLTNYVFTSYPTITVTLQKNGDFSCMLRNFIELSGAFRNPPSNAPIPYTDNFQRCERFYQTGSFSGDVYVPFRTKMNGTPSVSLSSGSPENISDSGFVTSTSSGVYTWSAEII